MIIFASKPNDKDPRSYELGIFPQMMEVCWNAPFFKQMIESIDERKTVQSINKFQGRK
jgi:hypothetical protein